MLGKGAKRKLDEDEEGLEGKAPEEGGGGRGSAPEALSKVSYTLQRQTIFNISLLKLYSQRPPGEPGLRRRVLISNMLRRIQDELQRDGSLRPLLLPPHDPLDEGFRQAPSSFGVLAAPPPSALLTPVVTPPPSPHPVGPPMPQAPPAPPEACLTPASLLEEDGGELAFCTPPLSPPAPPPAPPLLPPGGPVPPSPRESGPSSATTRTSAANAATMTTSTVHTPTAPSPYPPPLPPPPLAPSRDCRTAWAKTDTGSGFLRPLDPPASALPPAGLADTSPSPPPPPTSPSGFLSDLALDDVLFADIDTSMYDFDPCTAAGAVGVAAGGGGLAKLSSVVTADDLLKSRASPYGNPAPQVSANQPFKMDLTELDHIMEVLVGS